MNEIVKYHNYINSLKFTGFTVTDFNFLIMLCSRMRDKDVNRVTFNFMELRELTNYKKSNSVNQFVTDLKRMNEKLMNVTCSLETESEVIMFVLFPTFIINKNEQTLTVSVNEKFKFILNELIKNFTRFDLKEFVTLESKYSKSLYRLLKQYRTTGKYEITVNDLKTKMDCPKSYNNKQFMQNIINPAVNSLQNYFQNLKCEPQYARKRGRPVTGYIFIFTPETSSSGSDQDKALRERKIRRKKSPDKYSGYHQRTYDYDALEKELLNQAAAVERTPDHEAEQLDSELRRQLEKCRKGLDP